MSPAGLDVKWRTAVPPERSPRYNGFHPSVITLPAGHKRDADCRSLQEPMIFERDQTLHLRDDINIYADIYRPTHHTAVPAIVAWGPYGKSGTGTLNLDSFPLRVGIPKSRLSGFESFEGLDPAEWIPRGYAIVNVDPPGVGDSEGNLKRFGRADGQDGYDAIEEIARLPWCNGKVAMAGNSWLAISQWFIAAERPPHLACIAPLEGASDIMREMTCRGGILETQFGAAISNVINGRYKAEDLGAMLRKHPLADNYWDDKRARIDQILVPSYILASYSTNLHTVGSFRGYEEIPHDKKWLVVHGSQEWFDLYSAERIAELHDFFDHYTKGKNNGWENTPRIRATVLPFNRPALTGIVFNEPFWPHRDTTIKRVYLSFGGELTDERPAIEGEATYRADTSPIFQTDSDAGEVHFRIKFKRRTIILGPSRAVLFMKTSTQKDLDVYIQLRKADRTGELLQNLNIPIEALGVKSLSQVPLIAPLKYFGPQGILRASCREVAKEWASSHWQTLSHRSRMPIEPGQPVRLEIDIWPTGMLFEAGESLVMKVSGHSMSPLDFESLQGTFPVCNRGEHTLMFGGGTASFLNIPVVDLGISPKVSLMIACKRVRFRFGASSAAKVANIGIWWNT